jgi:branched-subunit amino acid transport protein AzlD
MLSTGQAAAYAFAMAAVIFFCRVFPFLFFRDKRIDGVEKTEAEPRSRSAGVFLSLVEKAAPPVAMTVLTFNAVSGAIKEAPGTTLPVLIASGITAAVHLWKQNALISIIGGTAVYITLARILAW